MTKVDFDPFAVHERQYRKYQIALDFIAEAIEAIEDDRPNAAKRHLQSALGVGILKRLENDNPV